MKEIIVVTREELEEIIENCISRHLPKMMEPANIREGKLIYSLRELADFLGCSITTAQKLKNRDRIRYKQYDRISTLPLTLTRPSNFECLK